RADIYALGVVGYEMLAGMTPFYGPSPQQILAAHVTQTPVPISKYRPDVPEPLAAAIMRCLENMPADRFQTARELREQLGMVTTPAGGTAPARAAVSQTTPPRGEPTFTGTPDSTVTTSRIVPRNRKRTVALVG